MVPQCSVSPVKRKKQSEMKAILKKKKYVLLTFILISFAGHTRTSRHCLRRALALMTFAVEAP